MLFLTPALYRAWVAGPWGPVAERGPSPSYLLCALTVLLEGAPNAPVQGRDCLSIRPLNGMLIYVICREEASSCRGLTSKGTCSPCPLSSSSLSQMHTHMRSI